MTQLKDNLIFTVPEFKKGDKVYYVKGYFNNGWGTIIFKIWRWYIIRTYPYSKIAICTRVIAPLEIIRIRKGNLKEMDENLDLKLQALDIWKQCKHEVMIGEWFLDDVH